jgi:hypothetical protein
MAVDSRHRGKRHSHQTSSSARPQVEVSQRAAACFYRAEEADKSGFVTFCEAPSSSVCENSDRARWHAQPADDRCVVAKIMRCDCPVQAPRANEMTATPGMRKAQVSHNTSH